MGISKLFYDNEYDKILIDSLSSLRFVPSLSGGEGRAYFIDDNFIIKQYLKSDNWKEFDRIFSKYCKEMQTYAKQGYKVPMIYAWTKVPNIKYYTKESLRPYDYYILEERVKGRELYFGEIHDAYSLMQDICSRDEFKKALKFLNGIDVEESALTDEILKRFFEDYVQMNEYLEGMSDDKVSKFLRDANDIYNHGKHCYPDIVPFNIFAHDGELTMIDARTRVVPEGRTLEIHKDNFIQDLAFMFVYNGDVSNSRNEKVSEKIEANPVLKALSKKNAKVCVKAMSKFLKLADLCCDGVVSKASYSTKRKIQTAIDVSVGHGKSGEIMQEFGME